MENTSEASQSILTGFTRKRKDTVALILSIKRLLPGTGFLCRATTLSHNLKKMQRRKLSAQTETVESAGKFSQNEQTDFGHLFCLLLRDFHLAV